MASSLDPARFLTAMAERCTKSKAGNKSSFPFDCAHAFETFLNMRRESNHCDECWFTLRSLRGPGIWKRYSSHPYCLVDMSTLLREHSFQNNADSTLLSQSKRSHEIYYCFYASNWLTMKGLEHSD